MEAGKQVRGGAVALLVALALGAAAAEPVPSLATAPVRAAAGAPAVAHEGVVEAVRQTVLAAQVPGAVVALDVKAGDTVKAGQLLVRLDARAAEQNAAASAAQVQAARAALEAATREFERQKQLHEKQYISRAALERAEAQYKAASAQAQAQLAAAGAARTQTGFYAVSAPYAGVVSEVPVVLGDMAMPGRPLVTLYDPAVLRVSARVPQTVASRLQVAAQPAAGPSPAPAAAPVAEGRPDGDGDAAGPGALGRPGSAGGPAAPVEVELAGLPGERIVPARWQLLPAVDPASHTLELRLELPAGTAGAAPGMFARVWLPGAADDGRLYVPRQAVVRRAELTGVYVVGADGRALLRQVRLGRADGDSVEVLAGVSAGERVALDPQAAARAGGRP